MLPVVAYPQAAYDADGLDNPITSCGEKMNKITQTLCIAFVSPFLAYSVPTLAQTAEAPTLSDGDSWLYNITEEKSVNGTISSSMRKWQNTVSRAGSKSMSVTAKPTDSNMPPKEFARAADWSVLRSIDGENKVIGHPYDFPLRQGKTWSVEYATQNPDARTKLEKVVKQYTVVGWTDVTVLAGKFHALKVEMEGSWAKEFKTVGPRAGAALIQGEDGSAAISQTLKATTPPPTSGRLYQAYWYVPEIKSHVKSITEDYEAGGALHARHIEELESAQIK